MFGEGGGRDSAQAHVSLGATTVIRYDISEVFNIRYYRSNPNPHDIIRQVRKIKNYTPSTMPDILTRVRVRWFV